VTYEREVLSQILRLLEAILGLLSPARRSIDVPASLTLSVRPPDHHER